jgi:Tfp pilus assembly PilM family ATPase
MGLDSLKSKLGNISASKGKAIPRPNSNSESGLKTFLRSLVGKRSFENEKILGVDITPHYVRICQLKNSYGKWMLTNLASSCMENFFRKTDIMLNMDSYAENLKDLISKNKITSKNVAFTVPSSSSIVKVLQFADMPDEDFREAAKLGAIWESAVSLEGGASEYEIYYKILRHNPAQTITTPEASQEVPVENPTEQPAPETPQEMPLENPTEQPAPEAPQEMPAENPTEEPAPETPQEMPVENPTEEPAPEAPQEVPVENPTEQPAPEAPQEMPVENPTEEPAPEAPQEVPVENPAEEAAPEAPQEMPAENPTEEPAPETPQEMPVENPTEQPAPEAPQEVPVENPAEEAAPEAPQEMPVENPAEEAAPEAPQEMPVENPAEEAAPEAPQEIQNNESSENENNDNDKNTMAEAEGAPAFEESAVISEELPAEPELAEHGPTMDVLFIATKKADVELYAEIISKAGLKPVLADVRCLALKHALESDPNIFEEIHEPYAFMEFGPDENYVFVVDGERTNIYNINMSEDDTVNLIYSPEDIEKMSVFVQNYASQALQIIQDHQNNYKTDAIVHLYVNSSAPIHVNDASSEPTMKVFVREIKKHMTGRTIKECDFCSHIEVPEQFAKKVNAEGNISAWATSVGIATRKLDIFDVQKHKGINDIDLSNLLPGNDNYKKSQINSIASTLAGILFLIAFSAVIGFSFMKLQSKNKELASKIESMDSVESEHNSILQEAQRLTIRLNQLNSLDDIQESLPSNQLGLIVSYRHISESYPEGILLKEVEYEHPRSLTIKGMSINDHAILSFVKRLNEKPNIMKVSLKTMETETDKKNSSIPGLPTQPSTVKNFTLSGTLNVKNAQAQLIEMLGKTQSEGQNGS